MSNQTGSEGSQSENSENKLETLQAQLSELTKKLEATESSKARILEESRKYKEGLQVFKSKQEEVESQKAIEEEERLRKEGQFQTLLEQREKRLKELEESLTKKENEVKDRDTAITNFRKASAFEMELGGKLRRQDYWKHVDFDSIAINPETGEIDKSSLSTVAQTFTKEYKELIDFGVNGNIPNGSATGSGSTSLTLEQWKKLPLKERKKRMKDVRE
jgi:DNA repair exonuclease SbcCD ATPase subunit